jgi:hypothetical protein
MNKLIVLIYTCKKNLKRRVAQENTFLKDMLFDYKFVYGDSAIVNDKGIELFLPCDEAYEKLSLKTVELIKWFYKSEYTHMLKIDDDSFIDNKKLENMQLWFDYGGFMIDSQLGSNNYHLTKCTSELFKRPRVYPYQHKFAAGGGYLLSKLAAETFLHNVDITQLHDDVSSYRTIGYEDRIVGRYVNGVGVVFHNDGKWFDIGKAAYSVFNNTIFHPVLCEEMHTLSGSYMNRFMYGKIVSLL